MAEHRYPAVGLDGHAGPVSQAVELDFLPPPGMRSAHVQSVVGSSRARRLRVAGRAREMQAASVSQILECADGTRLEAIVSRRDASTRRPLVVALHGWHGCADSLYLLSACSRLFAAGFDVARLHLRDHGDTHGLNEELFHSCRLDETVASIQVLREQFPGRPLALLGFSLGGNFALRVARTAPAVGLELDRVIAICPVLDPRATMLALDSGWFGYRLYFMRRWRASLAAKAHHFPDRYDFRATRGLRSIEAMTDWFVIRHTPYPDLDAYLDGYAITGSYLEGLGVPSTLITALDDPVIPAAGLADLARPAALEVAVTRYGGHCGFVSDYRLNGWLDDVIERRLAPLL